MTTIASSTGKTASTATPAATTRPNLLDRYRPIGIASVRAAALTMTAAAAKA